MNWSINQLTYNIIYQKIELLKMTYITTLITILAAWLTYKISYDKFWFSEIDRLKKFYEEYESLPQFITELYFNKIRFFKGLSLEDLKIISRYSLSKKDIINFRNSRKLLIMENDRLLYAPKWRFLLRRNKRFACQIAICVPFLLCSLASISFPFWGKSLRFSSGQYSLIFLLILGMTVFLEITSLKLVISIRGSFQILKTIAFYPKDKIKNL